ncbi:hypothetical protein ATE68_01710 [Sphingopyxis sp. H038]|uniref:Crp/Fnr family transcriptional regulator n=1 Tax=unclassified Sphingopyxis TaxID=2614943 RepID=UPI000730D65C|nr:MULTISPECIES: Crp/Fnr family transcriptional regulator [unclassified Sphingopyxis]KTE04387.1 hypothetical protein ATE78_01710 [Sphingopyxis sp. H012]KTE08109.1 hypothetical protein ATE76_16205 [Sphingopyxis sp. H093]KTE13412.1 hypothetical protein ATE70_01715 [Sphingopyxis sp. H053]KTE31252.1 hypothetical protein ATE75_01690 [Sphingopyxis sp. H080]KTE36877.1 hypothetical protein ATE68_01710 [Sphingopyxis sp. H038]
MAGVSDLEAAASALESCQWLEGHGIDLRGRLLSEGRLRRLLPGQWVFAEGDDSGGIVTVISGTVQVYAQAIGDREVLLSQMGRGGTIGQSVRFGGGPRLVTAISLGDSLILQAGDDALEAIARQEPLIWKAVASLHYAQLRGLVQMIAEFASLRPRQRLAARLVRFAQGHEPLRLLALAQQDLADMTGLSRKTVNASLSDLEAKGLIRRKYAAIEIVDLVGLQAYASAAQWSE